MVTATETESRRRDDNQSAGLTETNTICATV